MNVTETLLIFIFKFMSDWNEEMTLDGYFCDKWMLYEEQI